MSYKINIQYALFLGVSIIFGLTLIVGTRILVYVNEILILSQANSVTNSSISIPVGQCNNWKQVNTNGFGLPSEFNTDGEPINPISDKPFQGEEGFEVLVFKNQLYLGMESDNTLGARLWRTRAGVSAPQSQLDWEEVSAINGQPFGVADLAQVDHIDSLAEFDGWIYASTANRSGNPQGTMVFRSISGDLGTWENALRTVGPGFGKHQNENFKDMQVFNGHLCGGTWNEIDGAEVWCTNNGNHWQQKNNSGFGDRSNVIIWSGHVFDGQLYFGLQNSGDPENEGDGYGRLYRTSSLSGFPTWHEVFRTHPGTAWGNILGVLGNYLYISVPSEDGILVYRSSSGDPGSWEISSLPGFENNPENKAVFADGATIYNGALYVGVSNGQSNFELWRITDDYDHISLSERWEEIPTTDLHDSNNIYVQLITFNSAIYAWTSNPVTGQQVWRIACGISRDRTGR